MFAEHTCEAGEHGELIFSDDPGWAAAVGFIPCGAPAYLMVDVPLLGSHTSRLFWLCFEHHERWAHYSVH